jgi:DNA polymerase III subunit delta
VADAPVAEPPAAATQVPRGHLKLSSESLAGQLAQRLLPAYLICGDEPLLQGEAADAVRAAARAAGFSEREVHFIERAGDWDAVRASAANLSLFGARRVLELRLSSARAGAAGNNALARLLRSPDPDTLLLILTPRLDREAQGAEWVRTLQEHGGWVPVWPVDAARLPAWLRTRSRSLGLQLADEALELLAARTEGNLLAAQQELNKLALLGTGAIDAASVGSGVADSARFDVFQLGDAVLAGDGARAQRMLSGLRAEGTEPTLVLWALAKAWRDLWGAHSGGGRPPSWQRPSAALSQALRRAPRLSFTALAQRATRADRMIKGRLAGNAWDELALLTAELCGLPPVALPRAG